MIGSTVIHRQQRARRTSLINGRIALLNRLLRATGFVNVDIIHCIAGRQLIISWTHPTAAPEPLLAIVDPALERWRWPVADVWQTASAHAVPLCQLRIDIPFDITLPL